MTTTKKTAIKKAAVRTRMNRKAPELQGMDPSKADEKQGEYITEMGWDLQETLEQMKSLVSETVSLSVADEKSRAKIIKSLEGFTEELETIASGLEFDNMDREYEAEINNS